MVEFIVHILVSAVLIMIVAKLVSGIEVQSWGSAIIAALVLGLVNAIVKPVMVFLTFPITILTLGLFLLVVNALMFWLVAAMVPGMKIKGFVPAFLGALLLTFLNLVVGMVLGQG
jgi:putative membrane protein